VKCDICLSIFIPAFTSESMFTILKRSKEESVFLSKSL
jgi:hypothetical protein